MMRATLYIPLVALFGWGLACQTTGASESKPSRANRPAQVKPLPTPQNLPDSVRAQIRKNMKAHGDDMTVLMWSIIFLDIDGAGEFADIIKNQPWLTRPTGEVPENERVPDVIYTYQDQLIELAEKLSQIAQDEKARHDPKGMAALFGALAETCVGCHSSYLYEGRPP